MVEAYKNGDFVRKIQNPGQAGSVVAGPINDAGDILWKVRLPDGNVRSWIDGTFEKVPERETLADLLRKRSFGRKAEFSQLLTFHKLIRPLSNNIYSLHAHKIDFLPYQFKPLLKFISSPNQRLLIADDVGLGKTIEAGLILAELKVRAGLRTVLIACPAHLREKWRMEMRHRFGETFEVVDARGFSRFLSDYRDSNGQMPARIICSLQSLRSTRAMEALETVDPMFDLVIVDEAHHMRNSATRTHRVGELLSRQAEALLFLTATPLQTQVENLFNLLRLLDEQHFPNLPLFENQLAANAHVLRAEAALARVPPDMKVFEEVVTAIGALPADQRSWFVGSPVWPRVMAAAGATHLDNRGVVDLRSDLEELNVLGDTLTRSRKRDVMTNVARRVPQVLSVTYSEEESQLYRKVLKHVRSRYNTGLSFFEKAAMMMPQRRAASSIIGAARFYLGGHGEIDLDDYLASVDPSSGEELPDEVIVAEQDLRGLFEQAAAPTMTDTKYAALLGFFRSLQRQERAIVFSTFPSTLEYLKGRLDADGFDSVIISGQVPVDDRLRIVEEFRDSGKLRVLLSSEVGGEGLDLQFCSIVVNYDLPWNPMAVAQRIGRVDRIGQRSPTIRIVNFSVKDTIDQDILERLYHRIGLFERSVGLVDGILGEILERIADALLSDELTEEARRAKVEQEAQAMEARIRLLERMDEQSDNVFISDSFLQKEVTKANELHRYVSGDEVHLLVTEFLRKWYPRTILTRETNFKLTYRVDVDADLRSRFAGFTLAPGEVMPRFLVVRNETTISFDAETAERHSAFEHVNLAHPFVRFVVEHFKEHGHEFAKATHFEMRSDLVPAGAYLALIHKLVVQGARTRVMLLSSLVEVSANRLLSEDVGEKLLAEMVTGGRDLPPLRRAPEGLPLEEAYGVGHAAIEAQVRDLRASLKKRDTAFRARRTATLRAFYDRRIERQKILAAEHRSDVRRSKGFLTRAVNLEEERDQRITAIERGTPFDTEQEEILAAVVTVRENLK